MTCVDRYVSCGKSKLARPAHARELYTGSFFRMNYRFAQRAGCHTVYILSAKYGLVRDTAILRPYQQTVTDFSPTELDAWCQLVTAQLSGLGAGKILALVSAAYEIALVSRRDDLIVPHRGMSICARRHILSLRNQP